MQREFVIPTRYCNQTDYARFAPARQGQKFIIDYHKEIENQMMCLDLDKYDGPTEIYGSHDSDVSQWLDIMLFPCQIDEPNCEVGNYLNNSSNKMDVNALWDRIGQPVFELMFRDQRID